MPCIPRLLALTCLALLPLSMASAAAGEKVHSAATAASGVATKVEGKVKRGVSAGTSAVERGAKAAGRATTAGAKKIGVPGAGASSPKQTSPN